jgi:hypothetical protein
LLAATPCAILIHAASVISSLSAKLQRRKGGEIEKSKQFLFCTEPVQKNKEAKRKEEHRTRAPAAICWQQHLLRS